MEINTEEIMRDIRKKIKCSSYTESVANSILQSEYRFDWYEYLEHVNNLKNHSCIKIKVLPSANRLKNFTKKIIRRILYFCLQPTIEEQTIFNREIVRTNEDIRNFIEVQRVINGEMHSYIEEKERLYQAKLNFLEQKVEQLIEENEQLKKTVYTKL